MTTQSTTMALVKSCAERNPVVRALAGGVEKS